jgi:flagellar basal-body rod modification protein FlgD
MTVSPVTSAAAGLSAAVSGSSTIGRDQFLNLLVTQLRNQDPTSPMQPYEFASQLAQFSSVEQLSQLNDAVAAQADSIHVMALLSQTSVGAAMIGRSVLAEGDQVTIPDSGSTTVTVDAGTVGGNATLHLVDPSGKEVATEQLGKLVPGRQTITLPSGLPAGTYTYRVTLDGAQGTAANAKTYVSGVVDGMLFKGGQIVLRIGGIEIPIDSVEEIGVAAPASTPAAENPHLRVESRLTLNREGTSR